MRHCYCTNDRKLQLAVWSPSWPSLSSQSTGRPAKTFAKFLAIFAHYSRALIPLNTSEPQRRSNVIVTPDWFRYCMRRCTYVLPQIFTFTDHFIRELVQSSWFEARNWSSKRHLSRQACIAIELEACGCVSNEASKTDDKNKLLEHC